MSHTYTRYIDPSLPNFCINFKYTLHLIHNVSKVIYAPRCGRVVLVVVTFMVMALIF